MQKTRHNDGQTCDAGGKNRGGQDKHESNECMSKESLTESTCRASRGNGMEAAMAMVR